MESNLGIIHFLSAKTISVRGQYTFTFARAKRIEQ